MTATDDLATAGVSIWLDDLSRERILLGRPRALIAERDVVGITTNPTIFANAFAAGARLRRSARRAPTRTAPSAADAAFALMTADVRSACDILRPAFDATAASTDASRSR